jgi:hypothetical protein
MKKTNKNPLALAKQTLRTLNSIELEQAFGGVKASVGANTCSCPVSKE